MEGEGRHWLALLGESEAALRASDKARAALELEVASLRQQLQATVQGIKRVRDQADARYKVDTTNTQRMFKTRNLVNEQARCQVVDEQLEMIEAWRLLIALLPPPP